MEAPPYWPSRPPTREGRYRRPFGVNPSWRAREALWSRRARVPTADSATWVELTQPRATIEVRKLRIDLTGACPVCAAGWRQTGRLQVPAKAVPRRALAMTHEDDLLLREDAVAALDGLTDGLTLTEVEGTDGTALPWFQATAEVELPRVVDASNNGYTTDMQCTRCQRDGFFDGARPAPLYDPSAFVGLKSGVHFTAAYERRGVSNPTRLVAARLFATREAGERLLAVAGQPNLTLRPLRLRDGL